MWGWLTHRRTIDHRVLFSGVWLWLLSPLIFAADSDLAALAKLLRQGKYEECSTAAAAAIDRRAFGEDWYILKAEAELALGRYESAWETLQAGLQRYNWSIRLRQAGIPVARATGRDEQVVVWLTEIQDSAARAAWRYTDPDSLVALGRVALDAGADARQVLEQLFDRALKQNPQHREARLATGQLALDKQDFELAADIFRAAIQQDADDPDFQLGLAKALEHSDPQRAAGAVAAALAINPRHVPSLLFRAENAIDAEQYAAARDFLDQAAAVHPLHPDVWAYRALLAHLENKADEEQACRDKALSTWKTNPRVDHLIGRKLSQKYRFAEGAEHQQRALQMAENYLPARTQLVQDWLRLGKDAEAWKLAEEVHAADGYDVQIFNLLELKDKLARFTTLEHGVFRVRMEAREAEIYGVDVLHLLARAAETLCAKYRMDLTETVTVEIFPEPNDFAVRTFGLPGASGYLGVCFGKVITANSPASQAEHPANWQAVLWHEFCHVVTLQRTRNRMPRWLSEGISVYEERQANPAWGERMSPRYRQWILSGRLTPLAEMSGAFLAPETPAHLQFAYFQASLVVEFLIERHGLEALLEVLSDLAAGVPANEALERRYASLGQLDAEFQDYAKELARRFGPDLDWEQHDLSALVTDDDPQPLRDWVRDHPNSVVGLAALAEAHIARREFPEARQLLEKLVSGVPEFAGRGSGYELLAAVHREMNDAEGERRVLKEYVARADAAVPALLRLLELERQAQDWAGLADTADRLRAVNPFLPAVQRAAAQAATQLDRRHDAVRAWRALLALDPDDRAETLFQVARLLHRDRDPQAKRYVLEALELAPRYRAAQELLLEIVSEEPHTRPTRGF
jgi:tetratricopeptide (TPR) repeat protein